MTTENDENISRMEKMMKAEVKKEIKVRTKGIKKTVAKCMTNEIGKLEVETRTKLAEMKKIIENKVVESERMVELLEEYTKLVHFVNDRYDDHEIWKATFDEADKERVKVVNNILERISNCEDLNIKQGSELNMIERKRRKYNLRISNLKESERNEDVRTTVAKFIVEHSLLPGCTAMANVRAELQQAFRFGKQVTGRPKQILARFYSSEARNEVMSRSKGYNKNQQLKPIYLSDDHSPQDYALKQEAKVFMAQAHKKGKEPRFFDGELKISGEDGKKKIVHRREIQKFNIEHKISLPENIDLPPMLGTRIHTERLVPVSKSKKSADPNLIKSSRPQPALPKPRSTNNSQTATTSTANVPSQNQKSPSTSSEDEEESESESTTTESEDTPSDEENEPIVIEEEEEEDEEEEEETGDQEEKTTDPGHEDETEMSSSYPKSSSTETDKVDDEKIKTSKGTGPSTDQEHTEEETKGTGPSTDSMLGTSRDSTTQELLRKLNMTELDELIQASHNTTKEMRREMKHRKKEEKRIELQLQGTGKDTQDS